MQPILSLSPSFYRYLYLPFRTRYPDPIDVPHVWKIFKHLKTLWNTLIINRDARSLNICGNHSYEIEMYAI